MFNPADLPENIPLFPLPRALLLPRTRLPLNIFEPRYLAMFEDVLKTSHRLIGMVQPMETPSESDEPRLHLIGCAGRVVAFTETGDGRYMISLGGISRFRIQNIETGFSPYARANINWGSFGRDLGKAEKDPSFLRKHFLGRLERFFSAVDLNSDWESLKGADDELLINSLSMLCPFDIEDKQALLEAPTLADRRETLVTLIEYAIASGGDEGTLQ
ncbi:MAG: ATP-dependent protease [Alphaproteobacteria bacterium]|nr:ATP-dependent protease [Alphaproteobacteria bacterium]